MVDLGYQDCNSNVHPAFIASFYQASKTLEILNINEEESPNLIYEAFRQALEAHSNLADLEISLTRHHIGNIPIEKGNTLRSSIVAQQTDRNQSKQSTIKFMIPNILLG